MIVLGTAAAAEVEGMGGGGLCMECPVSGGECHKIPLVINSVV